MAIDGARPAMRGRISAWLSQPVPIAPLAMFRALFGLLMVAAVIRFRANGWIDSLYVEPAFHFSYAGFSWVKPPGYWGTHALFAVMGLSALGIMLGWKYRASAWTFFLSFTYAELMDKSTYLNHYYFVSIMAFLLLWVPANGAFSLDAAFRPSIRRTHASRWQIGIFKLQIGLVYFFAGLAKVNADWLLHAQPLALWLPAKAHLPLIGPLLDLKATAYLFSWAGAAFDLSIAFLLLWRRTLPWAYAAVVVFHGLTALLFPVIGVFPWVMMLAGTIFLPSAFHARLVKTASAPAAAFKAAFRPGSAGSNKDFSEYSTAGKPFPVFLAVFFAAQLVLPLRYVIFPGNLFWTEQGYRFSWRVMLMEKAGHATFYVSAPGAGVRSEISNCDYLTPAQEKMMATQPDMIVEFARHIAGDFARRGQGEPEVRVHSYVTLNGRGSRLYIDSTVNLAAISPNANPASFLKPFPFAR